jgi:membrane protein required for colicin V production
MYIDVIFIVLMSFAFMKGMKKGFIQSLFTFTGFFIGIAAGIKLSAVVGNYLASHASINARWLPLLSFIIVFALIVVAMHYLGKFFQKTSELVMMGWLNKLTGVILYVLLYGLTYSVVLFYAKTLGVLSAPQIAASSFYPYVAPVAPDVMNAMGNIIPFFKDLFSQLESFFSGVSNKLQ